ncbi:PleD family two-component system response regulator [candidate division KSB1 bacterium]
MKKILIVDDEPTIRESLKGLLGKTMPEVEVIDTGRPDKVLSIVQEHLPDLILLDLMMPGVNGLQILKDLKNTNNKKIRKIPVVIITGIGNKQIYYKAKDMGALDCITKPINEKILVMKIKRYV